MRHSTRFPFFVSVSGRSAVFITAIGVLSMLLLAGCAKPLVLDETLPQQLAELSCVEQCRTSKVSCDADAKYDYRQCQAGYGKSFRSYRWCLASASGSSECGYPWWSCAENLYGYCANRYQDCTSACASQAY